MWVVSPVDVSPGEVGEVVVGEVVVAPELVRSGVSLVLEPSGGWLVVLVVVVAVALSVESRGRRVQAVVARSSRI